MNNNKGWLYLKRAFVLLMGTLLVWQTFGTDVTYAFAQGSVEAVQALTQPVDDADGQADEGASVDGSSASDGAAAGEQTGSTEGESDAEANEGPEPNAGENDEVASDDDSSDAAAQSGENGIALASDGDLTGTYNPDADAVDVSDDCEAAVTLYKDSGHTTPLGDTAITTSEKFYARLQIDFKKLGPTLATPNVMYRFPSNVSVKDMGETPLIDSSTGDFAGTWYIQDNIAYFKYNEAYLNKTVTHAFANLDCGLSDANKGDGSSETIKFNGSSTSTTVYIKDGDVNASKFGEKMNETWNGPTYNQADNSYTWTIKISPTTYATNVKVEDTIGLNLTFDKDSFKLVNASGEEVSGQCDVTVSGQVATVSLGDLTAGDYYVQYKTTVNSLPTADNTAISNVSNKVKYSWGADNNRNERETSKTPQEAKYSMVSKSADGSSTPSAIKWVVKLNGGSIKADMGGYTFIDTLSSDQTFVTSTGVTVTDSEGKSVTVSDASMTSDSLSFKLPNDAGEKEYTVTYYTKMTNESSLDTVKNTAEVTPPDPDQGPEGEGTGTYNPPDRGTYITKTLTSTIDSANYDGKASWKSEILFSDMASSTDPTKIVFSDQFGELPNGVKVSLGGDVTLKVGEDGTTLVEGVDYTITKASGEVGAWNDLFKITFANTDAVRSLIGQAGAKVVVTYSTQTTEVSGEYPTGTYKNKSSVKTDKKSTVSAEASYTIERGPTAPTVIKNGASTAWNGDYEWTDGTKGAWITDWNVYVNRSSKGDPNAVLDLAGKAVAVTDKLPADTVIVDDSASYALWQSYWPYSNPIAVSPTTDAAGNAVFDIATAGQKTSQGGDFSSTKLSIVLSYKTATKKGLDIAKDDESAKITNTAQASSGEYAFPKGSDTVTLDNKALSKSGKAVANSSAREYTVTVNENAYDLVAGADMLTLVDDLDYRGELAASTITVRSSEGIDLLASNQASYTLSKVTENGNTHTRLTLTLPDSMKVVVTYRVIPSGNAGDEMKDFSNSCSLSGVASSATNVTQTFNVATSSGGTGSESWGISLTKYDSSGKKSLEGATFELWKIDLNASTAENIVQEKVDTQASDANGKVSFGSKETPLLSNTLYYFVETAAPAGYEISFTGNTYVMLKSDATKDQYQDAHDKAVALVGVSPSSAVSYSAFDELAGGSFSLGISKEVKGAEAPKGAEFTFHAEATGDNAADAPALSDVKIVTDAKGEKTYTGTFTGTLSDSMNGKTFTYNVRETGTAPNGWTYDSGTYTATVTVSERDAKLVGDVSYAKATEEGSSTTTNTMTFTNTYRSDATGSFALKVKKTVNGGALKNGESFTFSASATGDNATEAPAISETVTTDKSGIATFPTVNVSEANIGKTYTYTIHETNELGSGWTKASDVTATVEVGKKSQDGTIPVTVKYNNQKADYATFNNKFSTSTTAKLSVSKTVLGATEAVKDTEFSFALYDVSGLVFNPKPIDTLSGVKDGETKQFTKDLTYTAPGIYKYCIHEVTDGLSAAWLTGADVYATVTVGMKKDRTLYINDIKYGDSATDTAAKFINTYALAKSQISVEKTVNGGPLQSGEKFTFTLLDSEGNKVAGTDEITATKDSPVVTFGELTFESTGTYTYTVHETSDLGTGWTNDDDFAVTFTVELGADRNLHVTNIACGERGYEADGSVVVKFDNTYEEPEVPEEPRDPEKPKDNKPEQPEAPSEEKPEQPKETKVTPAKTVIPATDDVNRSLLPAAFAIAVSGAAFVAIGLLRNRRSAR